MIEDSKSDSPRTRLEEKWLENYEQLKAYVKETGHLPGKTRMEYRKLFN